MIHFESDYLEGCCPQILEALRQTNLEQTLGYGEDPHCEKAADMIRYVFDCPEAEVHFLVGGTQTNATVIASQLRPHQGVLCAESGHINIHETGAVESSGHKVLALPATDGKISAAQVRQALEAHHSDFSREHMVQPGMVYISFPTELGTIYSRQELEELHTVCQEWEIPLFVDGARLGYGLEASGCNILPKDLPRLVAEDADRVIGSRYVKGGETPKVKIQPEEVVGYEWATPQGARNALTFRGDRELVEKALEYLRR